MWFAGVHSNVGGGYPDDSLAHVPLLWMAERRGRRDCVSRSPAERMGGAGDPNGPLVDSRGGLGSYYRYNPRSITEADRRSLRGRPRAAAEDPRERVLAHQRRPRWLCTHCPARRTTPWCAVAARSPIGGDGVLEHPTQARSRCADQERVWNLVWWRRIVYFTTVGPDAAAVRAALRHRSRRGRGAGHSVERAERGHRPAANLHSGPGPAVGRVLSAPAGAAGHPRRR